MEYIEFILLGLLQGITEFLPISSSGHLLIGKKIFNLFQYGIFIEIFLHLGTLFSILLFWHKDIKNEFESLLSGNKKYLVCLIIGTIPAGIVGLLYSDLIENIFFNSESVDYLAYNYIVLSIIIFISKFFMDGSKNTISYKDAILIGLAQSIAILPGFSRSGLTIVMGMILGLDFKQATKFSFFLAIPILLFASINSIYDYIFIDTLSINFALFLGLIFSFISGYFMLVLLHKILQLKKLWYFSIYCIILSVVIMYYV